MEYKMKYSNLVNREKPELEEILKDYAEWFSLDEWERDDWQEGHGYDNFGKIFVIKRVREITHLGLREAKQLTEIFEEVDEELWFDTKERTLLRDAGFYIQQTKSAKKSRMLRVHDSIPENVPNCEHTLGKEVEWRVVGEYEIHIAKYCPECGSPTGGSK